LLVYKWDSKRGESAKRLAHEDEDVSAMQGFKIDAA